jgi:peroxiredoxin Q/BCP
MTMPQPGDPAPDFALPDDAGTVRRLADQAGRWTVLFFYPRDDTPGCTTEVCSFRDAHADLEAQDVTVWGVSRDGRASHDRFRAKFGLPFQLLSDPDHAVHEAYGAWVEKVRYGKRSMGTQRSTVLVDPEGRVAAVWPAVRPEGHAEDVLEAVRRARVGAGGAGS